MSGSKPPFNPYAMRPPMAGPLINIMGRQSNQRISNTKRAFQLCAPAKAKNVTQATLLGGIAFDPEKDCNVCVAQAMKKLCSTYRIPKRSHHALCNRNSKTKGMGDLTAQAAGMQKEAKRLESLFTAPLKAHEKGSFEFLTKEAGDAFFAPKESTTTKKSFAPPLTRPMTQSSTKRVMSVELCQAVATLTSDPAFQQKHKYKLAPLAMLAFATAVVEKIVRVGDEFGNHFDSLTMTVPPCYDDNNPSYHSIVGQKLLLVDWSRTHGLTVLCPDANCSGCLRNERTNFSKNKTLFPIFSLDGTPAWCMVMAMVCGRCHRRFNSNDGEVLVTIPAHAAETYPVTSTYALSNKTCHLAEQHNNRRL